MSDDNDTAEKKKAIDYLDDGLKLKDEFVKKTLAGFNENITKEELATRIRADYFKSFLLRMAVTGKKITQEVKQIDLNNSTQ